MINILFHNPHLDKRGTTTALFDYAYYNETILGNRSYIAAPSYTDLSSRKKFEETFPGRVFIYDTIGELDVYAGLKCIDVAYWLKYGTDDGMEVELVRNVVHAVFDGSQPHCDKYAAVSQWLGDKYGIPYVPHIVSLPDIKEDYREALGIPKDAIVFGRHGGNDSFDDPEAHSQVYEVARSDPWKYFLFLNTDVFCPSLPNIIHLEPTIDLEEKTAFINTCDAMLHCRLRGETFGLAVCEFLHQNKPVITRINSPETHHINVLGDKGYYYENYLELSAILSTFVKPSYNYSSLVRKFNPETVMRKFEEVFLK